MKTYIFTTKYTRATYGSNFTLEIYRIKNNVPRWVARVKGSTGSMRGLESEAFNALIECGEIPNYIIISVDVLGVLVVTIVKKYETRVCKLFHYDMPQLITTEQVPTWAIGYMEYGDPTGLTEEEIETIDEWLHDNFPRGFVCEYHDDTSFTSSPLWGLPCDAETVDFYEP